jgi:hypothetical protein
MVLFYDLRKFKTEFENILIMTPGPRGLFMKKKNHRPKLNTALIFFFGPVDQQKDIVIVSWARGFLSIRG